jgi:hypothetical protein
VHLSQVVDFLGFRLQWRRKRGTRDRWYVYTFIADRPVRQLKDKIRALTPRPSQQDPRTVLTPDQPGPARLGHLLPARRREGRLPEAGELHQAPGDQMAEATAPLELDGRPPTPGPPRRELAANHRGRDLSVRPRQGSRHPLPLPRQQDPQTLAVDLTNPDPPADTAESPLRRDAHGGFGERHGETDREQSRHRVPCRLNAVFRRRARPGWEVVPPPALPRLPPAIGRPRPGSLPGGRAGPGRLRGGAAPARQGRLEAPGPCPGPGHA